MYEIVFDEEFLGGLTLRCSPNRAYRLPPACLLNLSHGKRLQDQKEGRLSPTKSHLQPGTSYASTSATHTGHTHRGGVADPRQYFSPSYDYNQGRDYRGHSPRSAGGGYDMVDSSSRRATPYSRGRGRGSASGGHRSANGDRTSAAAGRGNGQRGVASQTPKTKSL